MNDTRIKWSVDDTGHFLDIEFLDSPNSALSLTRENALALLYALQAALPEMAVKL